MTNKTELLRLLRLAWVADYVSAADCKKIDAILAAPAEDVRAVVEEPVISSAGDAWLWNELRAKYGDGSGQEEGFYAGWADCLRSQRPVVLPERIPFPEGGHAALSRKFAEGFNACLDAFEELKKC